VEVMVIESGRSGSGDGYCTSVGSNKNNISHNSGSYDDDSKTVATNNTTNDNKPKIVTVRHNKKN
jgi:hypothetical protein